MVHTVFCSADEAKNKYEAMKQELQEFVDASVEDEQKRYEFYHDFIDRY